MKTGKIGRIWAFALILAVFLLLLFLIMYVADKRGVTEMAGIFDHISANAKSPSVLWIEPNAANGIPASISVFKARTGGNARRPIYTYQIFLPGNAESGSCCLSWDSEALAFVDGTSYESGICPIPPVGTKKLYTFKNGNRSLASLELVTYQGSSTGVQTVFIDIDESDKIHTISAMDSDNDHRAYCFGKININGKWYEMPRIKGRGNYTWMKSEDKRSYNITLDQAINFPGIESSPAKKWTILSEIGDHSLLCNRSGFWLAHAIGVGQDTTSADVWLNGEYQGCYTVTPKYDSFVGTDGYLIEEDNCLETVSVEDGGDPQYELIGMVGGGTDTSCYNLITFKKIGDNLLQDCWETSDTTASIQAASEMVMAWLQDAWDAVRSDSGYNEKGKYYTDYIDIESFAKMYLLQEYIKSYDVCAGSLFFHRDGQTDDDKLIAGPLWDLDNAMGSTLTNKNLGPAGDRRSGKGAFITEMTEYKTSVYKTLWKHEDFRTEVILQYNRHHSVFDGLENAADQMINSIRSSAEMNHVKVIDITDYNLHKYSSDTCLEHDTVYEQNMRATTDSATDWTDYALNLKTYIRARSLWFHNTYFDTGYADSFDPAV